MIIYTTTYNRKERTIKALQSISKHRGNCPIVIADNHSTDGTAEAVESCASVFIPLSKNIGKGPALNRSIHLTRDMLINEHNGIFCVIDSDIFIDDEDFFFSLGKMFTALRNGMPHFGMVVSNQNNGHLYKQVDKRLKCSEGEVWYNDTNEGIASACTVSDYSIYKHAGGYRETIGVYGGHDGFMMHDINTKTHFPHVGIAININAYHPQPEPDDADYEKWKAACRQSTRDTGFCGESVGFFDKEAHV